MKQIVSTYTYNKTTGVITLTGSNIDRDQLLLVVNTRRNVTYYNFADSTTTLQAFTQGRFSFDGSSTSFTLNSSVISASSSHANGDALAIYYDDQTSSSVVTANVGLNELPYIGININVQNAGGDFLQSNIVLRRIGEYSYESLRYQGGEDEAYLRVYLDDGVSTSISASFRVWRITSHGSYANLQGAVAFSYPTQDSKNGSALPPKTWTLETGITGTIAISYQQPEAVIGTGTTVGGQPVVSIGYDSPGGALRVSTSNPLPVSLQYTGANSTAVKVDGSAVTQPVSGTVTANTGLTPLTDTQLRATAVPVSLASVPSHPVTGPLTNTELRATSVPVSFASPPSVYAVQPPSNTSRINVQLVDASGNQNYGTTGSGLKVTADNAGWKLLGSRNWNSDQSVFTIDTTGYSELRFQGYTSGGVTSKIEVLSLTGGEDYYWSFGNTNILTFNHNVITTNQYVGEMRLEMSDWDPNESQTTQVFGRTSVSTITAYPPQGTRSALSNFTSVTSAGLADPQYGGRTALSVFNEGPGTLYIGPKNNVSTSSYMVRLSAGEYWECPTGSLSAIYWAIFGSAGTARVTQIY